MKVVVLGELNEQRRHWMLEQSIQWRREGKRITVDDGTRIVTDAGDQIAHLAFSLVSPTTDLQALVGIGANEIVLSQDLMAHAQIATIRTNMNTIIDGAGVLQEILVGGTNYTKFFKT